MLGTGPNIPPNTIKKNSTPSKKNITSIFINRVTIFLRFDGRRDRRGFLETAFLAFLFLYDFLLTIVEKETAKLCFFSKVWLIEQLNP
ncbi:MAG: hypothetical protein CSA36_08705 [Draconibacterium sp.]|nr:MAG: hypothetical protein CSA36_08705 [Draconibacterium sp.]